MQTEAIWPSSLAISGAWSDLEARDCPPLQPSAAEQQIVAVDYGCGKTDFRHVCSFCDDVNGRPRESQPVQRKCSSDLPITIRLVHGTVMHACKNLSNFAGFAGWRPTGLALHLLYLYRRVRPSSLLSSDSCGCKLHKWRNAASTLHSPVIRHLGTRVVTVFCCR